MYSLYNPQTEEVETFTPQGEGILLGSCKDQGVVSKETARILWKDLLEEGWVRMDELTVEEIETTFFVRYEVCGPLFDFKAWALKLCQEFPPYVYGTLIRWSYQDEFVTGEAFRMKQPGPDPVPVQ